MTDVPEWLAIPRPEEICHELVRDGPCSCDTAHPAASQQVVYTLHFDPPYQPYPGAPAYKCAGHYTGITLENRLAERLAEHEAGRGARLTQVQREAGGTWRLASVEPGGHDRERQLKQRGAARRCEICRTETAARWREATSAQSQPHGHLELHPEPEIQPDLEAELEPG